MSTGDVCVCGWGGGGGDEWLRHATTSRAYEG